MRKRKSDENSIVNIPCFDCNAPSVKKRLGQGSFRDVYTVDYKAPGKVIETVVVKKVLPALDQEEKKLFYKEVALLNGLNHPNIVKMKSVCQNPLTIMLEYCYFDFKPFGEDLRVTSLSGFLLQINEYKCQGFHDLVNHVAIEIIQGLAYLHSKGIAHRDVKPAHGHKIEQQTCKETQPTPGSKHQRLYWPISMGLSENAIFDPTLCWTLV